MSRGGGRNWGDIGEKTNSGSGEEPNRITASQELTSDVRGGFIAVQSKEGGVSSNPRRGGGSS